MEIQGKVKTTTTIMHTVSTLGTVDQVKIKCGKNQRQFAKFILRFKGGTIYFVELS